MAEGKNKIIVYADWMDSFDELTDEEAGKLIKHFFKYVNDMDPVLEDRILRASWIPIEKTLKRDLKKYEQYIDKQRENGQKGGRPKKPKKPKGLLKNPTKPKKADSDKDSVSDNVNVNDIDVVDALTIDSFYPLEILKKHYLSKDKVLGAVIDNPENGFKDLGHLKTRLDIFCSELLQNSETIKTPKDFASHFRRWHKVSKKIEHSKKVSNGRTIPL